MRIEGLSFKGWRWKNGDLDQLRFLEKFTINLIGISFLKYFLMFDKRADKVRSFRIGAFLLLDHISEFSIILVLDDLQGKYAGGAEFRKIAAIHILRRLAGAGTIRRWLLMCAGSCHLLHPE